MVNDNILFNEDIGLDYEERCIKIGSVLKAKRMEFGMTIACVVQKTRLKQQYIEMIEDGLFNEANRKIYLYGYICLLTKLFNLDTKKVINFLENDNEKVGASDIKNDIIDNSDDYLLTKIKRYNNINTNNAYLLSLSLKLMLFAVPLVLLFVLFKMKIFNH